METINKIKKYFIKKYDLNYWVNSDKHNWVDQNGKYFSLPHQYLRYGIECFLFENNMYPIYKYIVAPIIGWHIDYCVKKYNLILSEEYDLEELKK